MKRLVSSLALCAVLAACSSGPPAPPPFTPAGVFDVSIDALGNQLPGTLTIESVDGAYTGSLATEVGTVELSEFVVDGMQVTFVGTSPQFSLTFKVTYEGAGFAGEMDLGGAGTGSISGVKR